MKKNLTRSRIRHLPVLTCLLWLLSLTNLSAQNIGITWDNESGCQIYKPGERKDFLEDIGSGNCVRVCENSTATYSLTNSSNSWPAVWSITGGTVLSSNNTSCTVQWGSSGWGFVSVTITTPNGPKTKEMCLEIIDGPKANYTIFPGGPFDNDFKACLEQDLYFTNLSDDNGGSEIVSYFWDFGDGVYSSEFEPTHAYTHPGDYKAILTITNACNCTSTIVKYIHINDVVSFDITCNSVVCENGSDTYTVPDYIAEACPNFAWKVEGGTITSSMPYGPSINVTWDNVGPTGFGYVTFDATACGYPCSAVTIKVPVVQSKGTIVGDAVVCAYDQYRYKLPQWPTTDFVWSVVDNGTGATIINTDQRNEVIVQTGAAGDIVLRCTYTNTMLKCGGYAEYNIHVRAMGIISGPKAVCQNSTATYTMNNGYIATWTLKRPNGTIVSGAANNSFSHLFTLVGKYTLTVTGTDFCQPEEPFIIRVDKIPPPPNASDIVGPLKICVSTPLEYSLVNTEPGTVLVWSVTNGTFTGSNYGSKVTVSFNPGFSSYTVSVRRENAAEPHCQSAPASITLVPHVVTPLTITGQTTNICPSSITGPYNASYLEGEVYEWSLSNTSAGSISSGQGTATASVQWNLNPAAGTTIKLRVRKCNVWYNASLAVAFTPVPTVTINNVPATVCAISSVSPTLGSSPALTGGSVTWDFGDGSPTQNLAYNMAPSAHSFPNQSANTVYTITATITNPNGCLSPITVTKNITVMPTPVAFISPDPIQVFCNTVTPFTLTATVNYGSLGTTTIKWYKNGVYTGSTGTTFPVSQFGDYSAYVSNSNGCGSWTNIVQVVNSCGGCTVSPVPTITLNATQTSCTDYSATASASPAPLSYTWGINTLVSSFIGTPTATSANIRYDKAGNHTIAYYATYPAVGGGQCVIPRYKSVIIPFIAKIMYDVQCSATPGMYDVTLIDFSQYYPSAPADTKTFYINGTPYSVPVSQTQMTVTVPGNNYTFGIKLTKAGYQDCSDYVSESLPVYNTLVISAPTTACNGVGFNFTSNIAPAPGVSYYWNFGDNTYNSSPSPTKIYAAPGTYTVTLNVSVNGFCTITDTHTVTVNPNGLSGSLSSDSPNCEGSPITITFANTGTPVSSYAWMKDTSLIATTTTPSITVNQSGAYWVTLSNTNGCIMPLNTTNAAFIMSPDPVITGPDSVCAGVQFELSGYAGGGSLEYRWLRNGSAVTSWSTSPVLSYTSTITSPATATFTVEVRISDGTGGYCTSSASQLVTTYAAPTGLTAYFHVLSCNPYTVALDAVMSGPGTFNWSNGMSGQSIEVNEGGPYKVTFTNPGGCTQSYQFDVPKDPEVYLWIFPSGCYDFCFEKEQDADFDILGPAPTISFSQWEWIKDGSVDQFGSGVVPNYTISQTGKYELTLDNGYCHKTSDMMEVNMEDCKCSVKYEVKEIKTDYKPFCHYIVTFHIDNPYSYPIVVNIGTNTGFGVFQPGAVTVPPGGGNFVVNFIPTGFTGGSLEITMTSVNEKGDMCKTTNKWSFPTCRGDVKSGDESDDNDNILAKNSLMVYPNPTRNATDLSYNFANEKAQVRTIEIYTLMGILLEKHSPEDQRGIWNVNLGRYAAGQYIVVMREDGVLLDQKAIIKE